MLKPFRSSCVRSVLFAGFFALPSAHSQVTAIDRQLQRVDVAVSGFASITKSTSGTNYLGDAVANDPATTLGALVQVRYTKSAYIGFEGTYSYARFTENYSITNFPTSPFGVQTNASEYTLGYVAHLPSVLGFQPFASGGGGAIAFKPTPLGGQGLPERARAAYYYDLGVEDQFSRFFGVRAQFRQLFYKAPDFGANYLTINKQTIASEPSIGIYVRF